MRMTSFSAVGIKRRRSKADFESPQIEAQRSGFNLERRSDEVNERWRLFGTKKRRRERYEVRDDAGTPDAIRTHDLQSRSLTLYPAELQARIFEPEYYNASRYESKQFSVPAPPRSPKLPAFGTALRAGGDVISRAVRSVPAPCQRGSRGIRRPVRAA